MKSRIYKLDGTKADGEAMAAGGREGGVGAVLPWFTRENIIRRFRRNT